MKRKRTNKYVPVQFARAMVPNPESALYDDVGLCHDYLLRHKNLMQQYGLPVLEEDCKNLSRTLCIIRDWIQTKQAYKITKELADDLFAMDDLSFPADSLRLPYRTVFMDFSELGIPAENAQRKDDNDIIYGVFMTLGDIMYYGEAATMCGFVTLIANKNGGDDETEIHYGGIAFDYDHTKDGKTLRDTVESLTKQFTGPRDSLIKALLFAAYLSSEQPDIEENEVQKRFYRKTEKLKTSSVRKWDVGIRYTREVKRYRESNELPVGPGNGNGTSKRPHIRKAHWHVYRFGKGRAQKKVLWLPPIEVNCRNKAELPVVIRETGKEQNSDKTVDVKSD